MYAYVTSCLENSSTKLRDLSERIITTNARIAEQQHKSVQTRLLAQQAKTLQSELKKKQKEEAMMNAMRRVVDESKQARNTKRTATTTPSSSTLSNLIQVEKLISEAIDVFQVQDDGHDMGVVDPQDHDDDDMETTSIASLREQWKQIKRDWNSSIHKPQEGVDIEEDSITTTLSETELTTLEHLRNVASVQQTAQLQQQQQQQPSSLGLLLRYLQSCHVPHSSVWMSPPLLEAFIVSPSIHNTPTITHEQHRLQVEIQSLAMLSQVLGCIHESCLECDHHVRLDKTRMSKLIRQVRSVIADGRSLGVVVSSPM
eukprot:PhF_6_TR21713/c1_g1_i4/m.31021